MAAAVQITAFPEFPPSLFPQHQVHHPAPTSVRPFRPTVGQYGFVVAPGGGVPNLIATGAVLVNGASTTQFRFGDYSSSTIDPTVASGSCALVAQQYFAAGGAWRTRIAPRRLLLDPHHHQGGGRPPGPHPWLGPGLARTVGRRVPGRAKARPLSTAGRAFGSGAG